MNIHNAIPQHTVDILAKGLYQEALLYGFGQNDILRFVNSLLQVSMQEVASPTSASLEAEELSQLHAASLPLITPELSIRSFCRETDAALLHHWLKDSEGQHFLRSRLSATPMELEALIDDENHILGMIQLPDDTPIGCLAFLDYDQIHHKAELRKLIGDISYRNQGYGKAASSLWIRYGLDGLGLRKIYLNTLRSNTKTSALMRN